MTGSEAAPAPNRGAHRDSYTGPQTVARFDDVHVVFNRRLKPPVWALRGLNLEVKEGQVLGLLGPNGAGKTTSLCCLLGLMQPTSGNVLRWGHRITVMRQPTAGPPHGVLLEDTRLPPFLTVHRLLSAVCAIRGLKNTKKAQQLDRVVSTCHLQELLDRRTATLSKGQARRVGLAAALIADPPLLVLDEPSAGLDVSAQRDFDEMVRTLRDGKRTLIIASHLLGDVEATCTHIAIMVEGRMVKSGRTESLLKEARQHRQSAVHVPSSAAQGLQQLGIDHEPSRYAGLLLVKTELGDEELLARLAQNGIVPGRVEPRVDLVSFYLDVVDKEG